MAIEPTLQKVRDHARETALLSSINGLVEWDEQTHMPPAAAEWRAEQQAYLAGQIHKRSVDPRLGEWLGELRDSPEAADGAGDVGCVAREMSRVYDRQTKLSPELVEEVARVASQAHHAWVAARKADDFKTFAPVLERMLGLQRERAEAFGYTDSPYDALLDEFEPGETGDAVGATLTALRDELSGFVKEIVDSGVKAPSEITRRSFPIDDQSAFGRMAAEKIGFDFAAGSLDIAPHPFCGDAGPRDVRLTTRYQENEFADAFFSTLHEAGHGLYEQGLPADWFGLPQGTAISLGIHESQSRMWENLVGRSRGFWRHFFPRACEAFPEPLAGVEPDTWWFAINEVTPSLIRVDSDEATYNLHIVVRYELERAMIEGDLAVADLPGAWNEAYTKTVGITPPNDADGCLQDVHWSMGAIGYFPTYALGNLYASQLFEQATEDLGDLEASFAEGDFTPLLGWLREKVHSVGQRLTASQLVEQVTGKPLSAEPLMRHLRGKFGPLYGLGG
ncbi:MAG: carboxypeptidase M32 [Planctomycetota bacterium]